MNLSHAYDVPPPPEVARKLLPRALELGVTQFDTAALYGFGANEELVGDVLSPHRARITLVSKGGMNGDTGRRVIDGRPAAIIAGCEQSLRRLRADVIDLYYLHRWDKRVPIEESMGAMAELVRTGKVRTLGLSEVSAQTLRRAHAVHPIAAVQSEYSLWTRNPEIGVLEACRELGARFVAFSPIARGWLSGKLRDVDHFVAKDLRRAMPRFQAPYFEANRPLLDEHVVIAQELGCTPAQLALAWVLAREPDIIPLTGTRSIEHLEENLEADTLRLSASTVARLDELFEPSRIAGHRYSLETQLEIDTEDFSTGSG
jgi:aryl-alcohol dehydrogenase-like predicted oxidoreductase